MTPHQILVHVLAGTNRHAGHADILREQLDGAVGMSADVREGATLSDDVLPTGQRPSAVATGRPRVLVIGGKLKHVRKARELGLDVVHAQFPDEYDRGHWPYVATLKLLLDKWRMRRQLAARGISPVASAVGRSAQDVREFVQAHGLPITRGPRIVE